MITPLQYIQIASIIAESSHCARNQVGALVVKDGNIIAFGYNGTPRGFPNKCEDIHGNTLPEVLHAESNAITKLARSQEDCEGADLYTTLSPCFECAKLIIQSGIKAVYYLDEYRNTEGLDLLEKSNVKVIKI